MKHTVHPENYILIGEIEYLKEKAIEIVREEAVGCHTKYEGDNPFFFFELRYYPPFAKEFKELKRLQGIAAKTAGRRDQFRGYVVIDLSAYLTHEKEHFFDMTMYFLADMGDFWRYVFLVDNANDKAAKAMVSRMLSILLRQLSCEVWEVDAITSRRKLIETICKEQGVECSASLNKLLQEVLDIDKVDVGIVAALLRNASASLGSRIERRELSSFFKSEDNLIKYMLSEKQYSRLMSILERSNESVHEEKEAVC